MAQALTRAAGAFLFACAFAPAARIGYLVYPANLIAWAIAFGKTEETAAPDATNGTSSEPRPGDVILDRVRRSRAPSVRWRWPARCPARRSGSGWDPPPAVSVHRVSPASARRPARRTEPRSVIKGRMSSAPSSLAAASASSVVTGGASTVNSTLTSEPSSSVMSTSTSRTVARSSPRHPHPRGRTAGCPRSRSVPRSPRGSCPRRGEGGSPRRRSRRPRPCASTRFIGGEPTNAATNRFAGLVEQLLRRVDLLEEAVAQDGDAVAQGHRLDLVVRDVDGGGPQALVQARELAPASARGASRRGWTAARPSGRPRVRGPSPGPSPPAGADRRRAPRASARGGARCRALCDLVERCSARPSAPGGASGRTPMFSSTVMCGYRA